MYIYTRNMKPQTEELGESKLNVIYGSEDMEICRIMATTR